MPIITIKILEGNQTDDQVKNMMKEVTEVVKQTLNVDAERISIYVEEMRKDRYSKAGVRISDIE